MHHFSHGKVKAIFFIGECYISHYLDYVDESTYLLSRESAFLFSGIKVKC